MVQYNEFWQFKEVFCNVLSQNIAVKKWIWKGQKLAY